MLEKSRQFLYISYFTQNEIRNKKSSTSYASLVLQAAAIRKEHNHSLHDEGVFKLLHHVSCDLKVCKHYFGKSSKYIHLSI